MYLLIKFYSIRAWLRPLSKRWAMNYVVKLLCSVFSTAATNVWSQRLDRNCFAMALSHYYINDLIEMSFGGVKLRTKRKITVL